MSKCVECQEVITQPVCSQCLSVEMEDWLQEAKPELLDELKLVADESFGMGDINCILCKERMNICTYCFTEHILEWLGKNPKLIPEFVTFFNYDLERTGYMKELIDLV